MIAVPRCNAAALLLAALAAGFAGAQPLLLMHATVDRTTFSGCIAGPERGSTAKPRCAR